MWIYDEQSLAFLDVNAAAVARYGYSPDEFRAMTLADIRPAEDVPALVADAAAVPDGFEGGRRWRHRRKDGSLLTVEIATHPVPWPGRRARVVLVLDVTPQAALESRLLWQGQMLTRLASREPLQTLLDELAAFVCTLCPGVMSSVMLFDAAAGVLRSVAAHGMPPEVQAASDPTPVRERRRHLRNGGSAPRAGRRRRHRDRSRLRGLCRCHPALQPAGGLVASVLRHGGPAARHRRDVRARRAPPHDASRSRSRRLRRRWPGSWSSGPGTWRRSTTVRASCA